MDIDKPVGNNRIHTKQTAMAIYIAKTYPPIQLIFQLKLVSKKKMVWFCLTLNLCFSSEPFPEREI